MHTCVHLHPGRDAYLPHFEMPCERAYSTDVILVCVGEYHAVDPPDQRAGERSAKRVRSGARIDERDFSLAQDEQRIPLPHVESNELRRTGEGGRNGHDCEYTSQAEPDEHHGST